MEYENTKDLLREVCGRYGDDKWSNELSLPEIIHDHLIPYLDGKIPLNETSTGAYVRRAKFLFEFWKKALNKPRSNAQKRFLDMMVSRFKEGYTEAQMAQAIIGLSMSDFHIQNGYYHIYYVARSSAQLELMINNAEKFGVTEPFAAKKLELFETNGIGITGTNGTYINPRTGKTIK